MMAMALAAPQTYIQPVGMSGGAGLGAGTFIQPAVVADGPVVGAGTVGIAPTLGGAVVPTVVMQPTSGDVGVIGGGAGTVVVQGPGPVVGPVLVNGGGGTGGVVVVQPGPGPVVAQPVVVNGNGPFSVGLTPSVSSLPLNLVGSGGVGATIVQPAAVVAQPAVGVSGNAGVTYYG